METFGCVFAGGGLFQAHARYPPLRQPTGEVASPGWLFPELGKIDPDVPPAERLKQLAKLMTDDRNGRFARTIVNRMWAQLMGRGDCPSSGCHADAAMERRSVGLSGELSG